MSVVGKVIAKCAGHTKEDFDNSAAYMERLTQKKDPQALMLIH